MISPKVDVSLGKMDGSIYLILHNVTDNVAIGREMPKETLIQFRNVIDEILRSPEKFSHSFKITITNND